MSVDHERLSDMPPTLRWVLVFIKQVGFPILVSFYLAYMHFVEGAKSTVAMNDFKEVISGLKTSIDKQNRILSRKHSDD